MAAKDADKTADKAAKKAKKKAKAEKAAAKAGKVKKKEEKAAIEVQRTETDARIASGSIYPEHSSTTSHLEPPTDTPTDTTAPPTMPTTLPPRKRRMLEENDAVLHASDLTLIKELERRGHAQDTADAALEATRDSRANRILRVEMPASGAACGFAATSTFAVKSQMVIPCRTTLPICQPFARVSDAVAQVKINARLAANRATGGHPPRCASR